jgi:hypothetical protein
MKTCQFIQSVSAIRRLLDFREGRPKGWASFWGDVLWAEQQRKAGQNKLWSNTGSIHLAEEVHHSQDNEVLLDS